MIFYLTYNDSPSGIFSSQVIDVVKFFNTELKAQVKLVSFISLRGFFKNRKKIKQELSESLVLPMFPGVKRWRLNIFLLRMITFIYKPKAVIGRSVLATQLGLLLQQKKCIRKVIYDGRGAITAEWKEYQVVTNTELVNEIFELEKEVVLKADYRMSVSEQLVNYWKREFNYEKKSHVIIPCTLNKIFETIDMSDNSIMQARNLLQISKDDIVLMYSGSVAGWQSFHLLYDFIKPLLLNNKNIKLIFLANKDENISKIEQEFKGRIFCFHVKPEEVPEYLLAADYGLLIRENTITNQVASPVKFAEYLACGLPVVISNHLGDYSQFVEANHCGFLVDTFKISPIDKKAINRLALNYFTKKAYFSSYQKIINFIGN